MDNYKYLGVWLDCEPSFQTHIKHLQSKITSRIGFLFRNKASFTRAAKHTLVKLIILPYLDVPCHLQNSLQHSTQQIGRACWCLPSLSQTALSNHRLNYNITTHRNTSLRSLIWSNPETIISKTRRLFFQWNTEPFHILSNASISLNIPVTLHNLQCYVIIT